MKDKQLIFSMVLSALVAGLTFWALMYGKYIVSTVLRGGVPLDSIVFLIPILVIAVGFGVVVCLPVYVFLVRADRASAKFVLPVAAVLSLALVLSLTRQYQDLAIYVASLLAAVVGALTLFWRTKGQE